MRNSKGQFVKGSTDLYKPPIGVSWGRHSDEAKKKISMLQKGRAHKPQQGFQKGHGKISNGTLGKHFVVSQKTREQRSRAMTGRKLSDDTRRKISEIRMANPVKYWLGKTRPPHSLEARKKMSESHKGERAYQWKGGITPLMFRIRHLFEYRQWRSDVFVRDDYTCQDCGRRGIEIEAHHVKSFASIIYEYAIKTVDQALLCYELWNTNNGRTLCKMCHKNYASK